MPILIAVDASHVTSFIDNTKVCHPVYAVCGKTLLSLVVKDKGNLGLSANLAENRETIGLLPIFDEKRHPGRTEEQIEIAKKSLFLKCMEVPFYYVTSFLVCIIKLLY